MTRMPKGALLHAHLDATVNTEVLWTLARTHGDALHVSTEQTLTGLSAQGLGKVIPIFQPFPKDDWSPLESLTDAAYEPGKWVPLLKARENFDKSLGGAAGFDEWVLRSLTISPSEAYLTHNTTAKVCCELSNTPFPL